MKNRSDKDFIEYFVKNILENYKLITKGLLKSEKPDFRNDNFGLEITRVDQSLEFQGFISKVNNSCNKTNIKKFNKTFKNKGGRIIKKDNPIINTLNIKDTFYFNDDYIYIIPGYKNDFSLINKAINNKLKKLNTNYDENIAHYYLGIFTTIHTTKFDLENEFKEIKIIQSKFNKKYEKIAIIFLDKICEYNFNDNKYKIIENINKKLFELAVITNNSITLS